MNARILAGLTAALATGGAAGYMFGQNRSASAPAPASAVSRPVTSLPKSPRSEDTGFQLPEEIRSLLGDDPITPENATARTFAVLSEPDPVRRQAALALLLLSMTPENARAMRQGTIDITVKTGRRQDAEWGMLMKQFGRVLGAPGLRDMKDKNDAGLDHALEGFAMADPAAARALLGELAPGGDRHLRSAWIRGAALNDPRGIFDYFVSGQGEGWPPDCTAAVEHAILAVGVHEAARLFGEATAGLHQNPGKNGSGALYLYTALTDSMFNQHWQAGTTPQMLAWIEQQRGSLLLHDAILQRAVKDATLSGSHEDAIAFLERMTTPDTHNHCGCLRPYYKENPQVLADLADTDFKRVVNLLPHSHEKWFYDMSVTLRTLNPARAMEMERLATRYTPLEKLVPGAQPFIAPATTTTTTPPP